MTSTSYSVGMSLERNSSRVLKPPGGGQTNIFAEENEVKPSNPRPKYDQQNSSNLNFCMNTVDPSSKDGRADQDFGPRKQQQEQQQQQQQDQRDQDQQEELQQEHLQHRKQEQPSMNEGRATAFGSNNDTQQNSSQSKGGRVPPGGFSSGGFW